MVDLILIIRRKMNTNQPTNPFSPTSSSNALPRTRPRPLTAAQAHLQSILARIGSR
jgi:hypothetical protein